MKLVRSGDVHPRPGAAGKFTDAVWQEEILQAQRDGGMRVHRFTYPPGAHSHWHRHEGEQALHVVAGIGRVKRRDGGLLVVTPGDLVYVAPGEEHWHGAGPGSLFVHLAFTASGGTDWLEAVTPAEYSAESGGHSDAPGGPATEA
jgi:quercetin dioxygenase-like cupin family protein